jgi:hypothetical protein
VRGSYRAVASSNNLHHAWNHGELINGLQGDIKITRIS